MSYKYMGADGYYLDNNNIDSLGIDHSGFSTRDELEYQYNRITNRDKMQPNGSFGTPLPSALSSLTNQYKNSLNGGYTAPSQWGLFPQQSSFTGTQYAQLATPNTMSDADYAYSHRQYQFRNPQEEALLRRIGQNIIRQEDITQHPYLDTGGIITVGKGQNVNNWNDFDSVHWLKDNRPATDAEKRTAFENMQNQRQERIRNASPSTNPFNFNAGSYENATNLRISEDEADYLMYSHLARDYDNLRRYLPDFDNAPTAAQDVAMDIQYNTGINPTRWPNFVRHFNNRDVANLANEVSRRGIGQDRNDWARSRILSIENWPPINR